MKAQRGSAGVGRRERARDTDTAGDARRDTHSAQHTPPTTTENVQKPRSHTHADARAKAASSYFGLHALFLRLRLSTIALV